MQILIVALISVVTLFASAAQAQEYPTRPIRFIIGYPPGTTYDAVARLVGSEMQKRTGQPVVIEHKPGANGLIGARYVATAKPDGYTLYFGSIIPFSRVFRTEPLEAQKDLLPISLYFQNPYFLLVPSSVPANSFREFIQFAKADPKNLKLGTTTPMLTMSTQLMLEQSGVSGKNVQVIPYKGSQDIILAMLRGDINLAMGAAGVFMPHIQSGAIRPLLNMTPKRFPLLPNVPTVSDAGLTAFDFKSTGSLWAPVGTPRDIIQKLQIESARALRLPAIVEQIQMTYAADVVGSTPEELVSATETELQFWRDAAKLVGHQPD